MEEDIKTIQEKLKIIESLCTDDCINKSTVIQPLIYAIEKLIATYKELEMQNKELLLRLKADGLIERDKYWIKKIQQTIKEIQNQTYKIINKTYIPSISSEIFNDNREKYEPMLEARNILINALNELQELLEGDK